MAKFGNRVKETTDSTGTGTIDLNGAPIGFRAFADEFVDGDTVYYLIVDDPDNPTDYEYGVGTFHTGTPDTLARDTVEGSSNSDNKVSWITGTKTVVNTPTAAALGGVGPIGGDDAPDGAPILDINGNELIKFSTTVAAVNEITVKNAATGASAEIQATGDDTNLDIKLVPKGTGGVKVGAVPIALTGRQTISIPAGAISPTVSNGCAPLNKAETSSNKVNYNYLAFDAAAIEYGFFDFATPKSYDASTMTFIVHWAHGATTTNFKVAWALQLLSLHDDDGLDSAAYGTAVQVNDTGGTTEDEYFTPESAAVTPSNTVAKQDRIHARISRVATDGTNDTMAVDAFLLGITIMYSTNAGNDA